jgi:TPR repeat protein
VKIQDIVVADALPACKQAAGVGTAAKVSPHYSYVYGRVLDAAKDYASAAQAYTRAAESGYALAAVNLGALYESGKGVSKDNAQAFKWYTVAAQAGTPVGEDYLGRAYEIGIGTAKDAQQAFRWYSAAAQAGNTDAADDLGRLYQLGSGTPKDSNSAVHWYTVAAQAGSADGADNPSTGSAREEGRRGLRLPVRSRADPAVPRRPFS